MAYTIASFMEQLKRTPATALITVVNVVVFALAERGGDTQSVETLLQWGASERALVWSGEYWRLVTPMFLHIGVVHLVWNTWAGWGWLRGAEVTLGSARFVVAYLLSGISGTAMSLLCHDVVSAGASGAAFGIIGVNLAVRYRMSVSLGAFWSATSGLFVQLALWLAIGLTILAVDNFAHLGGLVAGALITLGFTAAHGRGWKIAGVIGAVALICVLACVPRS